MLVFLPDSRRHSLPVFYEIFFTFNPPVLQVEALSLPVFIPKHTDSERECGAALRARSKFRQRGGEGGVMIKTT